MKLDKFVLFKKRNNLKMFRVNYKFAHIQAVQFKHTYLTEKSSLQIV